MPSAHPSSAQMQLIPPFPRTAEPPRPLPLRQAPLATAAERATYLAALPLFAELPARVLERVGRAARTVRQPRGATVFARGDRATGFWVVVSGRIQLLLPGEGGADKVLSTFGPGTPFGEAAMFGDTPYPVDCRAVEDTLLLYVPSSAALPATARCGELAQRFLRDISNRMHGLIMDIAQYTQMSAESRIATLLLQLLEERTPEARAADENVVRLPDRKRALASRLSVAPETFSRALRAFQDDGLIRVDGYRVQILDLARLSAAAQATPVRCAPSSARLSGSGERDMTAQSIAARAAAATAAASALGAVASSAGAALPASRARAGSAGARRTPVLS